MADGAMSESPLQGKVENVRKNAQDARMDRRFDVQFKKAAVQLVNESGRSVAQVARQLGIAERTLARWVMVDRREHDPTTGIATSESESAELARLRRENAALATECDLLRRAFMAWMKAAIERL